VRQTRRVIIVFPSEWKWSVYSIDKMPIHHHFLHDYSTLQCPSHTSINSNPYSRPPSNPFFMGGREMSFLFARVRYNMEYIFVFLHRCCTAKEFLKFRTESLRLEPGN
jgi:hypothetical protein